MMSDQAQYVTLGAASTLFAVPVERVQQILETQPITLIPQAPADFLGVIDLRGQMVPVMDLRTRLGVPAAADTPNTRIVVLDARIGSMTRWLGLKTDRVFEVTGLDDDTMENPSDMGAMWHTAFVSGVGRRNGAFVVVLDMDRLFGPGDIPAIESAA